MAEGDWYSASQAAQAARCSPATLYRALGHGELTSEKVGAHRRIAKDALREWARTLDQRHRHRGLRPGAQEREARRLEVAELHAQGLSPGQIAKNVGAAKNTIIADLDALGLIEGRRQAPRRLPPAERALRAEQAVELYVAGHSIREIEAQTGSSRSQISIDLAEEGQQTRPAHRPAEGPPAEERPCEWCREPFAPRYPSDGDRRFHARDCAEKARAAALTGALEEKGLLSTNAAAERLGIVERHIHYLRDRGELVGRLIEAPMQSGPVWAVSEDELWRFELERSRSTNRQVVYWLDEHRAVTHLERTGALESRARRNKISVAEMRRIELDRRRERRRRIDRHRRGLKPGARAPVEHARWWEAWQLRRDEVAYHQERVELMLVDESDGEAYEETIRLSSESERGSAREIMLTDWREHPGYWDRIKYPASRKDPDIMEPKSVPGATNTVWKAIKGLQNADTRNTDP